MLASGALSGVRGGPPARWLPSPEPSGAMLLVVALLGCVGTAAAVEEGAGPAAGADVLGGSQLGGGIRSLLGPSSSSS